MRPLAVLPGHRDRPGPAAPRRRPDATLPAFVGAFALGVVVAATALLGLQGGSEDTVPGSVHQQTVERAAAAEATATARQAALDDAAALLRRLVAALDSPATLTPGERAELRRDVTRQIERVEKIRVVRVPVPGPVVTVTPAPAADPRPKPARAEPRPDPTPTAAAGCVLELLGACLARP